MQTLETTNVRGIYSTSESTLHFGLNNLNKIDSLTVLWPNGNLTSKKNIQTNQILKISSSDSKKITPKTEESSKYLFADKTSSFPAKFNHIENSFDDFEKQILLPHKLSQFGPALTAGDINNDGLDDFYIGGAANQSPSLFVQEQNGSFKEIETAFWKKEAAYEDIDALFVDINNDGFTDLYVVSGGNEYPKNDFHYTDRIYLNQGNGIFKKGAILNSARISGSTVKAADYDGDGDLDLFIGARHTPQQYPNPASSMLLINYNGQLSNKTESLSPQLLNMGMVTDAIWSDYDNDSDLDLIVVGEWMPITIFENNNGSLSKLEMEDFKSSYGWWFSIEQGDFDNDGDMDYIAGNLGLNYKYKTSSDKPFDVYYNDFDANGNADIVLGYYNKEKHYPLRGFSCSSEQVPDLKKKIVKYDAFASMELKDVYGEEKLKNSLHYSADTFASVYIENLGNGQFEVIDLPNLAQLSNLNDMLVRDFNSDGALDVLAVGNLYVSEIETPRNDAGTGFLLLGNGKGSFTVQRGSKIGFQADKDAKKMVPLTNVQKNYLMIANNNDVLQFFELQK